MTLIEAQRLMRIRMDVEKWKAIDPRAGSWDSAFLIDIIDELLAERNRNAHAL